MREERIQEKKSHNVEKNGENTDGCDKAVRKKRMTYEERSAQVDREIRLIIISVLIVLVAITLIIINIIKTKEKENYGQTNNDEYVGENEIEINELCSMEMKEEGLPEFNLYEETEGKDKQYRFEYYKAAVKALIYPANVRSSNVLGKLPDEKQEQWNAIYDDIELVENEKGNSENVKELETLSSEDYRIIYELCHKEYIILPQGDMATRYGRNAGDALIEGLKEGVDYKQLITDFNISNEGYVTSFHYRDCEQKLADGCYWAGHNFDQFLYNYHDIIEQEEEHCTLMAYFYSFYGCEVSGEDGLKEGVDYKQLITDFNISNEGYVTSFHYRDCEQKLADGCYWAGHNFDQFLYNYHDIIEQEEEHCTLMAYFYSFYGCEVSGEDGVQHRNDLKKMNEETRKKLVEDYGYPEALFD